jgi:hypothetical protein
VVQGVLNKIWDLLRVQQEEMIELKAIRRAELEEQRQRNREDED